MLQIFNITAPIFFIIGLGYSAVRFGVFRFEELRGTAKFVMKVGLPAWVFFAIAAK
ncbi:MAG: AEC family transporter, partial [Neisseria elongata]